MFVYSRNSISRSTNGPDVWTLNAWIEEYKIVKNSIFFPINPLTSTNKTRLFVNVFVSLPDLNACVVGSMFNKPVQQKNSQIDYIRSVHNPCVTATQKQNRTRTGLTISTFSSSNKIGNSVLNFCSMSAADTCFALSPNQSIMFPIFVCFLSILGGVGSM